MKKLLMTIVDDVANVTTQIEMDFVEFDKIEKVTGIEPLNYMFNELLKQYNAFPNVKEIQK